MMRKTGLMHTVEPIARKPPRRKPAARRESLLAPAGKGKYPSVYTFDFRGSAWRVLWWLFFQVEPGGSLVLGEGWQQRCANETGLWRQRVCASAVPQLAAAGFIEPLGKGVAPYRTIRFAAERVVG